MTDTDQMIFARRMLYASICAYNITGDSDDAQTVPGADRVETSEGGYSYSVVNAYQAEVGFAAPPDSYTPAFFADGKDDINAALAGLTEDGHAVIALRGTLPPSAHGGDLLQWVSDWANDARIAPVDWLLGDTLAGKAERGFANAAQRLWPWIRDQVAQMKDAAPQGVVVTGHSKGGAMTYLIAALVQAEWPDLRGKIVVHAFAPAASVDQDFLAAYDAAGLTARTTRYLASHDIVPFLPDLREANIWSGTNFDGIWREAEWIALASIVTATTDGGYSAPGRLVAFGPDRIPIPGKDAQETALAAVIEELKSGKFDLIGDAHGITDSYAECFPPVVSGPSKTADRSRWRAP
jgi:hypothetical protein